jgi:hypothetical protein
MTNQWMPWAMLVALAIVFMRTLRTQRQRAAAQDDAVGKLSGEVAAMRQVVGDVAAMRQAIEDAATLRVLLVHLGIIPRAPDPAPPSLASVEHQGVVVTRDDNPDRARFTVPAHPPMEHLRPTVEAPPAPPAPAWAVDTKVEPPSTKPSRRREAPVATAPQSAARPVGFEDQVGRALARLERQIEVPPDAEARCLERIRARRAKPGLSDNAAPTDEGVDEKDARGAARRGTLVGIGTPGAGTASRSQVAPARPTLLSRRDEVVPTPPRAPVVNMEREDAGPALSRPALVPPAPTPPPDSRADDGTEEEDDDDETRIYSGRTREGAL